MVYFAVNAFEKRSISASFPIRRSSDKMDHLQILFKARLVVPAVLLVLLWLWEAWHPFFRHQHRYRHAIPNLGLTLFNSIVLAITVSGLIAFATDWTTTHQIGLLNWFQLDHGITLVAAVVLLDGWMYLWHRANHAIPFLWRFHRTHHSDTHMDVTTASRFHIGEHILSNGLRILLIPLFGLSIWQLVFYEILARCCRPTSPRRYLVGSIGSLDPMDHRHARYAQDPPFALATRDGFKLRHRLLLLGSSRGVVSNAWQHAGDPIRARRI